MPDARDRIPRERAQGQLFLFDPAEPVEPMDEAVAAPEPPPIPRQEEQIEEEEEPEFLPDLFEVFSELNGVFFDLTLKAHLSWSNRLTASAGLCDHKRQMIRISVRHYRKRPEMLPVTMAHEMLHLIVPNHGKHFRALGKLIAKGLGVTWRQFRYAELWADMSRYAYVYACPACGTEMPSQKRRRGSCSRCGSGEYTEEFKLVLTESRARPGPVLLGERPAKGRGGEER